MNLEGNVSYNMDVSYKKLIKNVMSGVGVKISVRLCCRCDSNSCFVFPFYLVALVSFA